MSGSHDFASLATYLNQPKETVALLKNSGSQPLDITVISFTNNPNNQFTFVSGGGAGPIPSGETREIKVSYLATLIGTHTATVSISFTYDGFSYSSPLNLDGQTMSFPAAQLWLENSDTPIATETSPETGEILQELRITVHPPYMAVNCGNPNQPGFTYTLRRGKSNYIILSDFGGSKAGMLLKKRQQILNSIRNGVSEDKARQELTETLNIMGQTWMQQTTLSDNLLNQIADVIEIKHRRFGIMAQEEKGYFIDVKDQCSGYVSRKNDATSEDSTFKAGIFFGSGLEHGVLEQLMSLKNPAVSTVKLLQIANDIAAPGAADGRLKIFLISGNPSNLNNQNPGNIRSSLKNYDTATLDYFQGLVENNGFTLIIPQDGKLGLENWKWKGKGYIIISGNGIGMNIDTHAGGVVTVDSNVDTNFISTIAETSATNNPDYVTAVRQHRPQATPSRAAEPIDMASGAYLYDHTDLQLGSGAPLGLVFTRSYNSNLNYNKRALGYGWTHNYDIYITTTTVTDQQTTSISPLTSHGDPGLGRRQPLDAAAFILSHYVALDLMKNKNDLKGWVVSSILGNWAVDQLTENAVTVNFGPKVMEFIKLPDGSYQSPPGSTTQLVKNPDGTFSLKERFGTEVKFDNKHRIASIADVDGNVMTFSFSGDKLTTIRDAFGRTLTFEYYSDSDKLLRIVRDSAGRSVSYAYENGDLTSYTDPENFTWQYGYDSNHRIKTLKTPLQVTTVTNDYDSLGRVKTQTVPRQVTGTQINPTVTYNFYFSGFKNMEEDPDGSTINYYYDEKGREYAIENALGFKSKKAFDGQNHIIQVTDPRGNSTDYTYVLCPTIIEPSNPGIKYPAYPVTPRIQILKIPS